MKFQTRISGEKNGELMIRGKRLVDLIGTMDYTSAVFFILTGSQPTEPQRDVLNAVLVACMDHGIAPASGFVPRVVVASGNDVTRAMAAGILAIGPYHGGAIESAMNLFTQFTGKSAEDIAVYVKTAHEKKERLAGFGHKKYTESDPRAEKLLVFAKEKGISGVHEKTARAFETALEKEHGRKLVLNIDGAVAVVLLALGLPPQAGNGIFALARTGGMLAHALEEKQQGTVVRRLEDNEVEYLG